MTKDRIEYDRRAVAVYHHGAPACRARGPNRAECLLEPGHDGHHEGNGFDDYGPMYRSWRKEGEGE